MTLNLNVGDTEEKLHCFRTVDTGCIGGAFKEPVQQSCACSQEPFAHISC